MTKDEELKKHALEFITFYGCEPINPEKAYAEFIESLKSPEQRCIERLLVEVEKAINFEGDTRTVWYEKKKGMGDASYFYINGMIKIKQVIQDFKPNQK